MIDGLAPVDRWCRLENRFTGSRGLVYLTHSRPRSTSNVFNNHEFPFLAYSRERPAFHSLGVV